MGFEKETILSENSKGKHEHVRTSEVQKYLGEKGRKGRQPLLARFRCWIEIEKTSIGGRTTGRKNEELASRPNAGWKEERRE